MKSSELGVGSGDQGRIALGVALVFTLNMACGGGGNGAAAMDDDGQGAGSSGLGSFAFDAGTNEYKPSGDSPLVKSGGSDPAHGDAGLTADNACGASSVSAEVVMVEEEVEVVEDVPYEVEVPAPVALYVMFDKSKSMANSNLWDPAVAGLTSFIGDTASDGLDVALQYFPLSGGSCADGSGYDTPAVDLGRLPDNAQPLIDSLSAETANGSGTPMEGALRGATEYCKAFQANNPDEKCVAVLVTDGKPGYANGCSEVTDELVGIVADAYDNFDVKTFTVGLQGADFDLLDQLAIAGGAVDCDTMSDRFSCDISSSADQLGIALAQIRDTISTTEIRTETRTETRTVTEQRTLDCTWQMPTPSGDTEINVDLVNVEIAGGAEDTLGLGRVDGESDCADRGWYYDDNEAPAQILACPETCDRIKNEGYSSVNILLGCETEILVLQ